MQPVAQAPAHRAVEDLEGAAAAAAFTRCIAASAPWTGRRRLRSRSSTAIPIVAVTKSSPIGASSAVASRCASSAASRSSSQLGQHGELVAAEARERLRDVELAAAGGAATSISTSSPAGVAVRVVDGAEAVEAEQHHRDAAAHRPGERLLEALLEEQPVRQPGQRVVQRLAGQALLQPAGLGQVGERDHEAVDRGRRPAAQRLVVGRRPRRRRRPGGSRSTVTSWRRAAVDERAPARAVRVARRHRPAVLEARRERSPPVAVRASAARAESPRIRQAAGLASVTRPSSSTVSRPDSSVAITARRRSSLSRSVGDVVGVDHHAVGRDEDVADVQPPDLAGGRERELHLAADDLARSRSVALEVAPDVRPVGGRSRATRSPISRSRAARRSS